MDDFSIARPTLTLLSEKQKAGLHDAALDILERTGFNCHLPEARRLLSEAGAKITDDLRVRIPSALVEKALKTVPHVVEIFDREGESAMTLEAGATYFGTGSDLQYTLDLQTGDRRRSVLSDVALTAKLCDALENIDFIMSNALPEDVSPDMIEPMQYREIVRNSTKPAVMTIFGEDDRTQQAVHQMACVLAGGKEAFSQRPNYVVYGQFVSPLQHDAMAVRRLMFSAEHRIPIIYVAAIMMGASGPVSMSGSLALANAETLAGLVMHQLTQTGAPFISGGNVTTFDMKTMVFTYNSPEWQLGDLAVAEMTRYYGLPVFGTAGATDSKVIDAQSGAEAAGSLTMAALSGNNLIHDVGYMDSGMTASPAQLTICNEIIGLVKRIQEGLDFDLSKDILTVIDEVGPGGHFMGHEHTLQNYKKEVWYPELLERDNYDNWFGRGGKDITERASEKAQALLDTHQPRPLDDAKSKEIDKIVSP